MSEITEGMVVNACIQWLFAHGCYVWRNNTGSFQKDYTNKAGVTTKHTIRVSTKGAADIIGVTGTGKFISVEAKRPGKKAEPHQLEWGQRITDKGGIYIVADSVDVLEAHKQEILG